LGPGEKRGRGSTTPEDRGCLSGGKGGPERDGGNRNAVAGGIEQRRKEGPGVKDGFCGTAPCGKKGVKGNRRGAGGFERKKRKNGFFNEGDSGRGGRVKRGREGGGGGQGKRSFASSVHKRKKKPGLTFRKKSCQSRRS